ncbi:hypothetical protein NHH03_02825 [Stieleria sp. TO1_6]|uniref:hypothetical protein n=1 Tax=Stieleria tagensis TaxID=2956795 RepID=UPI00209B7963|nr:hypothetical protein [Stieleria tagensis]MCO8120657.1 hypothetical protein [Stieleria tagensis]
MPNSQPINPYQPPRDASVGRDSGSQFDLGGDNDPPLRFQSDWSPDGLRARRSVGSAPYITSLALLCLLSLPIAIGMKGVLVITIPVGLGVLMSWIFQSTFRRGTQFPKLFPAFDGPVSGWVKSDFVAVKGPAGSLTAKLTPVQVQTDQQSIDLLLPFAFEPVQITLSDQLGSLAPDQQPANWIPLDVMHQFSNLQPCIEVSGRLLSGDLRGTRYHSDSVWFSLGMGFISVCFFAAAVFRWDMLLALLGVCAALPAGWRVLTRRADLGEFKIVVSPSAVVITTKPYRTCYAYHGDGAKHFRWSDQGLQAVLRRGKLVMLVPRQWFSESEQQQVQQWYPRSNSADRDFYIEPRI